MNLTQLLQQNANETWWANWLLYGRKDEFGHEAPLAEGRYLDIGTRVMKAKGSMQPAVDEDVVVLAAAWKAALSNEPDQGCLDPCVVCRHGRNRLCLFLPPRFPWWLHAVVAGGIDNQVPPFI